MVSMGRAASDALFACDRLRACQRAACGGPRAVGSFVWVRGRRRSRAAVLPEEGLFRKRQQYNCITTDT